MERSTIYDVAVVGAGPAGTQAAVSAAHQMRHVLLLDAGAVSRRRGRAYWSKTVEIQDAPVFPGVTGPKLTKALREWAASLPVRPRSEVDPRPCGIELRGGVLLKLIRKEAGFELEVSTAPKREGQPLTIERFQARTVVVATGFEDRWPDIEVDASAEAIYERYRTVFRYAGNRRGWHLCIRCDGHLHVDKHIAVIGCGDYVYGTAFGAQDFTDKVTILTNGRPHGMSDPVLRQIRERGIEIVEQRIMKHIGEGTDLLGFLMEDGSRLFFDGFFVDEGLEPNTQFLAGWDVQTDEEGLLVVDEDGQVLDSAGNKVPGLFAAGDIVAGERNLIATAFALGQNAGLSASDSLRRWQWPTSSHQLLVGGGVVMEKKVELYTQPGCAPCKEAARFLEERGVPYVQYDVTQDTKALDRLLDELGSRQTPTIVVDGEVLIGFDPDRLKELIEG